MVTTNQTLDQWQVLYGNGDGSKWLVVRSAYGTIPPDELMGLPLLGETTMIIRSLMTFRVQAATRSCDSRNAGALDIAEYAKNELARSLGIEPGRLISYANDETTPDLSVRGWQALTKAYYFMRGGGDSNADKETSPSGQRSATR
jgi:hypothetical protein